MSRELIVVADDLGASPGCNRGILRAHREGIVTAASLLVGMPTSQGAACGAAQQKLPLGLHFRLSVGQPMSAGPREVGLADDAGFLSLPRVVLRLAAGGYALEEALRSELRAQMSAFIELVPQPDHINSHHHLHLHPALLGPFLDEAKALGFVALRWPVEQGSGRMSPVRWVEIRAFRLLAQRGRARLRSSGLCTSDHFRGLALMDRLAVDSLLDLLRQLPEGCTELMCHPADLAADSGAALAVGSEVRAPAGSAALEARSRELDALCAPELRALIQSKGIVLRAFGNQP